MQFTLLQHWEDTNHADIVGNDIIIMTIPDHQWQKWYDEMMRRFREKEEPPAISERLFDVDESAEIGVIGIEHLQECLKFLANK